MNSGEHPLVGVLDPKALDRFARRLLGKCKQEVNEMAAGPFEYSLFEEFLPFQNIIVTPQNIVGVYTTVFVRCSGVFSSETSIKAPYRRTIRYKAPHDTHTQTASLIVPNDSVSVRFNAMIWSKESSGYVGGLEADGTRGFGEKHTSVPVQYLPMLVLARVNSFAPNNVANQGSR
jgi:hypothetical protein